MAGQRSLYIVLLYTGILELVLPLDRITDVKYVCGIHRRVVLLELLRDLLLRPLASLAWCVIEENHAEESLDSVGVVLVLFIYN
jgi:hypothetical protein